MQNPDTPDLPMSAGAGQANAPNASGSDPEAKKVSFKYVEDRGRVSANDPAEISALASHIVNFRAEDLESETLRKAKLRVLDLFGCGLGGVPGEGNKALVRMLELAGSHPRASVIGFGKKLSASDAALANAVISRSYDFEVMTVMVEGNAIGSHNSPTTCMTALALAEEHGLTGMDFLTALIIGDDIAARMLAASGLDLGAGWDASSIFTAIPAAAITARLLGLDERQTRDAMGHAIDMISGTTQSVWDSSPAWKLVGGHAARNGIFAAQLAATNEWPGVGDALCSGYGFFAQFTSGCINPDVLTSGLGRAFYGEEYFKPYPSCAATQAMHECALDLCGGNRFEPSQIERITVRVPEFLLGTALCLPLEATRDDHTRANFSVRYQIASAILRGPMRQEHYAQAAIHSSEITAILELLDLAPLPDGARGVEAEMILSDGRSLTARHDGMPTKHPMKSPSSESDILEKFYQQVEFSKVISESRAKQVADRVLSLESERSMVEVAELLS